MGTTNACAPPCLRRARTPGTIRCPRKSGASLPSLPRNQFVQGNEALSEFLPQLQPSCLSDQGHADGACKPNRPLMRFEPSCPDDSDRSPPHASGMVQSNKANQTADEEQAPMEQRVAERRPGP